MYHHVCNCNKKWGAKVSLSSFFKILVISLFVSGCAGSVDPTKLTLTPEDDRAVVLMKVPTGMLDYSIVVAPFDAEKQTIEASSFNAAGDYAVPSGNTNEYIGKLLKPGTYVFQEYYGQGHWSLCFHEDTLSFDVKPGEVLYLGEFKSRFHMSEIGVKATQAGETRTSAVRNYYFDDISSPRLSNANQNNEELPAVKAYVAQNMPNVNGEVKLATFKPTSFNTGRGLIGDRMCGGLFTGSSKTD